MSLVNDYRFKVRVRVGGVDFDSSTGWDSREMAEAIKNKAEAEPSVQMAEVIEQ